MPRASRATVVQSTLRESEVWLGHHIKELHLTINERVRRTENPIAAKQFATFLMEVGNGTLKGHPTLPPEMVLVPEQFLLLPTSPGNAVSELIDWCYPELNSPNANFAAMSTRAILTPLNRDVEDLNSIAVSKMTISNATATTTFLSADSIADDSEHMAAMYPLEFLQSLSPSGFPPHSLNLMIGMPLILLRNLEQREGLTNGTRLILKHHTPYRLTVEICNGPNIGSTAVIPRIDLIDQNDTMPFHLKRRQFPVRVAFAITINKSQGQSLSQVGIFLPNPVFSHGQLYVALSRSGNPSKTKILVMDVPSLQGCFPPLQGTFTRNVVYREVLGK